MVSIKTPLLSPCFDYAQHDRFGYAQHDHITTSQFHPVSTTLNMTTSPHHHITTSPHRNFTTSQHGTQTNTNRQVCSLPKLQGSYLFLTHQNGKMMPIDAETVAVDDDVYMPGIHRSHFDTCPDAKKFSKK
ncbi:MAG: hypothetical protein IPN94_02240 [Sphingobacteriales bacterium]|nr:hypothetical protein [Sphingobacteriales bacterium]